jgi:plastocyanin
MTIVFRSAALAILALHGVAAMASGVAVQVKDGAGKPVADVVLYAEPEGGGALPKVLKAGEIEQRGLKFLPLVTVIQTGSKMSFPNNDKVRHHIYSFSPAKKFDQKLYSGVTAEPQVFDKPGTVVLGCNIHDRMIAYVKIVDTPFFAKTDAAGVARIELPAAGKYSIKAWHFNMVGGTAEQVVAVKAGEAPTTLTFAVVMKAVNADDPAGPGS